MGSGATKISPFSSTNTQSYDSHINAEQSGKNVKRVEKFVKLIYALQNESSHTDTVKSLIEDENSR
jgi:hypothetical protein